MHMLRLGKVGLFATVSSFGLAIAAPAMAQVAPAAARPAKPASGDASDGAIADIVVTATKTGAQLLEKTPQAITVITGEQLADQGLRNVRDLAPYIPNVSFNQITSNAQIYVRGIGSNNVNAGSDPDVTTQVDGVYIARPSGQFTDFLDVQSIEVLRGPQGTLYGRNAVGGVINVNSAPPAHEFGGRFEGTLGNYSLVQLGGYLTGPLANNLFASIAANYTYHRGYLQNIAPGGHDISEANRGGIRVQLRWEPADWIDATTRADFSIAREYFDGFDNLTIKPTFTSLVDSLIGSYTKVALDAQQVSKPKSGGVSEEINFRLGNGFSLKSLTAFRFNQFDLFNDNDASDLYLLVLTSRDRETQYSQEFNLQYKSDQLKAVVGAFFFGEHDHQTQGLFRPPSVISPAPSLQSYLESSPVVRDKSGAVFAEGTFNLTQQISVVAGARYTIEHKDFTQSGTRYSLAPSTLGVASPGYPFTFETANTFRAFTPKVGLNLQLASNFLAYGSIIKGYKSGGFNYSSTSAAAAGFAPESIWAYEGGIKTQLLDRRLNINISGFIYDYKNLQVQALLSPGVISITNAASARIKGLEFEVIAKPFKFLRLTGIFSILDPRYVNFPASSVPNGLVGRVTGASCAGTPSVCTVDASGNYLTSAPRRSGLIAVDYDTHYNGFGFNIHGDMTARSRAFFDASNSPLLSQPGYHLFNASVSLTDPSSHYTVELWGRNLGNKQYFVVVSGAGSVPGGVVGDPLTFGVRVRAKL
ncbi:MAG: TonB-dependent receptor [Bradyrhizobium sp.]|nr:TonB-dependent receptor [Bradyrhizobium sp.]